MKCPNCGSSAKLKNNTCEYCGSYFQTLPPNSETQAKNINVIYESNSIRNLTITAVFMALTTVLTMYSIAIPGGHGYIHLGDSIIYTCAWMVGGVPAALAAGIGSSLADLFLGYSIYAPATLIIKFVMSIVCFLIMRRFNYKTGFNLLAMIASAIILVVGYEAYEYILTGAGGAIAALGPNVLQGVSGVVLGFIFVSVLNNVKALKPYMIRKADEK